MIIAFVLDQFDVLNNGTVASARRFVENLRKLGHTVRILTTGTTSDDKDMYLLPEKNVPLATYFARKQGMVFSKIDKAKIREFLSGADVVHFYMASPLARAVELIAREMNVPCIAAFHIQPENITYIIHVKNIPGTTKFFYWFLYQYFFKRFRDIHCPTEFIAKELRNNGYGKATLHVISNGVSETFVPREPLPHENINVLMMGRLSPEKRQDLLIEAVRRSKYAEKIQLILTGYGPLLEKYKELSNDLPHKPVFGFFPEEKLTEIIRSADIYVHASEVEIESVACMEAFSSGLVPIIANSPTSATPKFALDERSLFKPGDASDLASKIDYWIEHPEEKAEMGKRYAAQGDEFRVMDSVKQMVEVYKTLKPGRI